MVSFAKGFELAIIILLGAFFILITVIVMLRQAKKLPKSYVIEITDLFGQSTTIDELRQSFSTYDAAESYARSYRTTFGSQYKFKVIGSKNEKKPDIHFPVQ